MSPHASKPNPCKAAASLHPSNEMPGFTRLRRTDVPSAVRKEQAGRLAIAVFSLAAADREVEVSALFAVGAVRRQTHRVGGDRLGAEDKQRFSRDSLLRGNELNRILGRCRCPSRVAIAVDLGLENTQFHEQGLGMIPITPDLFGQLERRPLPAAGIALGDAVILVQSKSIAGLASDAGAGQIMALARVDRQPKSGREHCPRARQANREPCSSPCLPLCPPRAPSFNPRPQFIGAPKS